jgi:PleD family two-component response regulator
VKKLSALVIEEDVAVCESLCQLLRLLDIQARPAFNPQAAHLCLGKNPPDLVFLSSCIKGESRSQIIECLRGDAAVSRVPVVLVSDGGACPEVDGVVDVILRPASLEAVEKCLRKTGYY